MDSVESLMAGGVVVYKTKEFVKDRRQRRRNNNNIKQY